MEEWFEKFIEETVKLWTEEEHGDIPLVANYLKSINESKRIISKVVGDKGEDYVIQLAQENGYMADKTPRSWSDSDIFAFCEDLSGFNHLMLIQVKTTETQDKPETLNEDQVESLKNYSAFVLKRWFESEFVPEEFKGNDLILSCGYVGVITNDEVQELYSNEAYQFLYHNSYNEIKENIKEKVLSAHNIGDQ